MMCCTKYNTCLNYKIRCADCKANSDIYNHYPLYKDRDLVEVVRCKKCEHYNTSCCADGFGWCEKHNHGEMDDHFCSYGERRKEDG